jgi:hypothetical protein
LCSSLSLGLFTFIISIIFVIGYFVNLLHTSNFIGVIFNEFTTVDVKSEMLISRCMHFEPELPKGLLCELWSCGGGEISVLGGVFH